MRYVIWALKLLVFILLLALAMQNTLPVTLHLFLGYVWEAPLIVLLLAFFSTGAALGLMAGFVYYLRLRRELKVLKKELRQRSAPMSSVVDDPSDAIAN